MDLVSSAVRSNVSMIEPVYAASAIADAGTPCQGLHAELGARPVSMKICPAEDVQLDNCTKISQMLNTSIREQVLARLYFLR